VAVLRILPRWISYSANMALLAATCWHRVFTPSQTLSRDRPFSVTQFFTYAILYFSALEGHTPKRKHAQQIPQKNQTFHK
jgi:hypothetical protein